MPKAQVHAVVRHNIVMNPACAKQQIVVAAAIASPSEYRFPEPWRADELICLIDILDQGHQIQGTPDDP